MAELPDLIAGIYRHYKGPLYQVFGYGHDANADTLYDQRAVDDAASAWQSGVMHTVQPLGERICVVYMSLELTGAHTGPRLAFRNVEGADAFFDWVHPENGAVCRSHVGDSNTVCFCKERSVMAQTVRRFTYIGPTWEGEHG